LDRTCLIVLDNAETILQSGAHAGCYLEGYEDYGLLIRRVEKSPLKLPSADQSGKTQSVHHWKESTNSSLIPTEWSQVGGRAENLSPEICWNRVELRALVERYAGNALALKIVATTIQDVFDGNVAEFLKQDSSFGDIREL